MTTFVAFPFGRNEALSLHSKLEKRRRGKKKNESQRFQTERKKISHHSLPTRKVWVGNAMAFCA
jgi:hypothetical protein